ncbi:MAG: hypothetical protein GX868_10140 [Actinobacteria bacterium]|nr:hypothetical protein [Actinomycetota bacterium]
MATPFRIVKHLTLPVPPLAVWYAITTAQGLAGWTMPIAPDKDSPLVTDWVPNEHLAVHVPIGVNGAFQAFDYRIDERADGDVDFTFVHSGELDWSDEEREMTELAWDQYMFTLHKFLTTHLARIPAYMEAEAPAHKVGPNGWTALLARLGLGPAPRVGDAVRIERPGTATIEGTVDYVTDRFLGIEAPHELVRFHGRWSIGLPIAVADHRYLDPDHAVLDVEAERAAWVAWLAEG